ncbi:hypothetical protein AKJ49_00835 [candidate division MSBL1 archaeon SCGC-AAA382A03]|uniref:Uncharacterized protein n=1 Tax=candidate division MSBL1 archaeon SCGC-AAA382A03 TaxID=1698278 RepID=A0A133VG78_9EURY|nr:hypothetical protein AKJ49_00835 [candidate division MSBL1 archaeon SCGC-AAA382A03]
MKDQNDYPEKKRAKVRILFHRLLLADDVVRIKHRKGELSKVETSRIGGSIMVAITGILLEALRVKELGDVVAPVLLEKIERRVVNPLPYVYLLQMICLRHRITVGNRAPRPDDVNHSVEELRETIDLENIDEQWTKLKKERTERAEQPEGEWVDNRMFG